MLQHFGNCCLLIQAKLPDEIDLNRVACMPLIAQVPENIVRETLIYRTGLKHEPSLSERRDATADTDGF